MLLDFLQGQSWSEFVIALVLVGAFTTLLALLDYILINGFGYYLENFRKVREPKTSKPTSAKILKGNQPLVVTGDQHLHKCDCTLFAVEADDHETWKCGHDGNELFSRSTCTGIESQTDCASSNCTWYGPTYAYDEETDKGCQSNWPPTKFETYVMRRFRGMNEKSFVGCGQPFVSPGHISIAGSSGVPIDGADADKTFLEVSHGFTCLHPLGATHTYDHYDTPDGNSSHRQSQSMFTGNHAENLIMLNNLVPKYPTLSKKTSGSITPVSHVTSKGTGYYEYDGTAFIYVPEIFWYTFLDNRSSDPGRAFKWVGEKKVSVQICEDINSIKGVSDHMKHLQCISSGCRWYDQNDAANRTITIDFPRASYEYNYSTSTSDCDAPMQDAIKDYLLEDLTTSVSCTLTAGQCSCDVTYDAEQMVYKYTKI